MPTPRRVTLRSSAILVVCTGRRGHRRRRQHPRRPGITTMKVALIAPSAHNDLAFTQSMYAALQQLKAKYHFQLSVSENQFVVADAANIMRQYAAEGYNLIIAHGSQYGGTIQQLAPKYPKVSFAWGTASSTFNLPNVYAYQANSNEGGYVQGYMAALLSKTKVLGVIGPIAVGDAKLYVDGFKAGALAAVPEGDRARELHRVVQRREPDVQAGDELRRCGRRRPDRQLAVRRRSHHRREGEERRLVRDAVDAGVTRAEAGRLVAGLRLERHPQPDLHGPRGRQARRQPPTP